MLELAPADPEATAFLADARAALTLPRQPTAPTRLLLGDLSTMPDGPEPVRPDVMEPRLAAYDLYETALKRHTARKFATQATACEATGVGIRQWHSCREAAVLSLLAAAEEHAPAEDRPWHAARLNLYATAHGLKGWYRDHSGGRLCIHVNRIRRRADRDQGQHYVLDTGPLRTQHRYWVVDRDNGRPVYRSHSGHIARQWIGEAEPA
ncbi:hypothetical protein ACFYWD_21325 [Streptomyces sp. NPDC003781]|uniref:hypothetical protein n=1 Tax=Streptomyces sp. NPDC003781 TaxID=3364686 RepID=UPI0036BF0C12